MQYSWSCVDAVSALYTAYTLYLQQCFCAILMILCHCSVSPVHCMYFIFIAVLLCNTDDLVPLQCQPCTLHILYIYSSVIEQYSWSSDIAVVIGISVLLYIKPDLVSLQCIPAFHTAYGLYLYFIVVFLHISHVPGVVAESVERGPRSYAKPKNYKIDTCCSLAINKIGQGLICSVSK